MYALKKCSCAKKGNKKPGHSFPLVLSYSDLSPQEPYEGLFWCQGILKIFSICDSFISLRAKFLVMMRQKICVSVRQKNNYRSFFAVYDLGTDLRDPSNGTAQ